MEQEKGTVIQEEALVVLDDYSVIVADPDRLLEIFKDGKKLDAIYTRIEKMALGLVADVTTKEGVSQIKTCARQIASVKIKVDDAGKKVKAELNKLPDLIDENRRTFREKMEALQEEIRRPVTEIENREKEIDGIKAMHMAVAMSGSAIIRQQLEKVKAIELTEEKWKESLAKAEKAVAGEVSALNLMLQEAEKREEEARELEELRRKQEEAERIIREQKIKEEAERRAKAEAEARAAAEKVRLEREKAEAERKAAEAEKARQEAQERAERAEMERKAVESKNVNALDDCKAQHSTVSSPAPAPSKWTPEMKAVNKAVYEQIAAYVLPEIQKTIVGFTENGYRVAAEEAAKAVVKAILTGKIRNLKVEY
jgi:chromosome segregation ATPase